MLFFKRIFDFRKEEVQQQLEQRSNTRHVPGKAFPLKVELALPERTWPARLLNISAGGLAVEVDPAVPSPAGLAVRARLTLEDHHLDLRMAVTHSHTVSGGRICGLSLGQADFEERKAFLQLLTPITIGSTMRPVPEERVPQDEPQVVKLVFTGELDSVLSVWLEKTFGTPLHSFEFRTGDYFVKADARSRVLGVFQRQELEDTRKGRVEQAVADLSAERNEEIRRLFRWVVWNLPEDMSGDVREFLREMAK